MAKNPAISMAFSLLAAGLIAGGVQASPASMSVSSSSIIRDVEQLVAILETEYNADTDGVVEVADPIRRHPSLSDSASDRLRLRQVARHCNSRFAIGHSNADANLSRLDCIEYTCRTADTRAFHCDGANRRTPGKCASSSAAIAARPFDVAQQHRSTLRGRPHGRSRRKSASRRNTVPASGDGQSAARRARSTTSGCAWRERES